jgi:HK97 gp10 family phage protein
MNAFDTSDIHALAASFTQSAANVGALAQVVVRKTTMDVERDAKNLAPVDTGNLKSSIGHSDLRTVGRSGVLESEVGPTANYGLFVEAGTSRHGPQPFMGPALERQTPSFVAAMEQLAERSARGGT